jgi:AcrR family transcriptional regulator
MNEHSLMPRAGQQARAELTPRERAILDAALEQFERRGYGATPVPELARAAGVAVGTLYRYFPGKAGLVNALYRRWKQAMHEALTAGLDLDRAPVAVFHDLWGRLTRFVAEHPEAFAFLENHHHAPYLDDESRALVARIDDGLARLVVAWQRAGVVREGDPALLVATAFGAFVGAVRHQRDRGLPITAELGARTSAAVWALLSSASDRDPTTPR